MATAVMMSTGCSDLFEPAIENHKDASALEELPSWAVGLLGHAYISNPLGSWSFNDVATDDAVSNDQDNSYRKMATGAWRANNNPMQSCIEVLFAQSCHLQARLRRKPLRHARLPGIFGIKTLKNPLKLRIVMENPPKFLQMAGIGGIRNP